MEWQNSVYDVNIKFLGLENASPEDRRKALYEMEAEDVIKTLPMAHHWCPTVDGSYITKEVLDGMLKAPWTIGKPDWCKRVMVGDTGHDVSRARSVNVDLTDTYRERS